MNMVKEPVSKPQVQPSRPAAGPGEPKLKRQTGPITMRDESKKLIVGRDITLSGEISSCNSLVVEGEVRATLEGCRTVQIARSGVFRGKATINTIEIAGLFEGELIVKECLILRSTGRVVGTLRYRDIEIERGGRIAGTVEILGDQDAENRDNMRRSGVASEIAV